MAEGDHIRFEATFAGFDADIRQAKAILQAQLEKALALGDEALVATLRAQEVKLAGKAGAAGATGTKEGTAEIERANQAIIKQNALKRLGSEINVGNLELLREALRLETEQAAVMARLHVEAGTAVPFPPQRAIPGSARQPRTYEQTAGGLAAAEEAQAKLNAEIGYYNEQLSVQRFLLNEDVLAQRELLEIQKKQVAALAEQRAIADSLAASAQRAYGAGVAAADRGRPLSAKNTARILEPPEGVQWTKGQKELLRYNAALGEYDAYAGKASVASERLSANFTRLGVAQSEASNQLRRHGALTTEFISALARGETTVSEFGYHIGTTIGKFAGWTAAATATYGALGAVVEFGKGAIDTASGVQRLTRTIDDLDKEKATQALINLSAEVNVPVKEAADAVFQFSRTFHNLDDAVSVARLGLAAFKLDGVSVSETVKAATAIHQQFGVSAQGLTPIFDELAQGQQKFNARMTEQIPLLQRSASAVKNAGGDLRAFIQLSTIALRTTQLSGSQLGTAFLRSASTFLSPSTTKGKADREVVSSLGINVNQGFTDLITEALRKAPSLSPLQRQELSQAVFGPLLGGRTAGFFTGGPSLLGPVGQQLSPDASRGTLQTELQRELGTTRERLHSFINEMQRTGAALADSGLINFFNFFVSAVVEVGHVFRGVIQVFDGLPPVVKEVVTGVVALRTAMLLLNRTRFGASFGGLSRIARIPGIDPSFEAQSARASLATGTRAAMQIVEDNIAQSIAASTGIGAKQAILAQERAAVQRAILRGEGDSTALMLKSNAINQEIERLNAKQVSMEREKNAQLAALAELKAQQFGLTATSRNYRTPEGGVLLLQSRVQDEQAGVIRSNTVATEADAAAQARTAAWRERQGRAVLLDAAAMGAATKATTAGTLALDAEKAASTASLGRLASFKQSLIGLTAALDPLTIALIGLPFIYGAIKSAFDNADSAASAASKALKETPTTIADLQTKARDLAAAAQKQKDTNAQSDLPGFLGDIENFGLKHIQELMGTYQDPTKASKASQSAQSSVDIYQPLIAQARADGLRLVRTQEGRRKWLAELEKLRAEANHPPQQASGDIFGHTDLGGLLRGLRTQVTRGIHDLSSHVTRGNFTAADNFKNSLKLLQEEILGGVAKTGKAAGDYFSILDKLNTKQLAQTVKALSDRANVFGLGGDDLKKAGETYLFLAARYRASHDEKGLQLVTQAQQAFISAVNKNVGDLLKEASNATTFSAESGDIGKAISSVQHVRQQVRQWVAAMDKKFHNYPAIIKAVGLAAKQIDAQLNDQLKSAIDQQIQLIEQNASLAASRIQGFSPEAEISRAEATLAGLRQALAKARAEGASWATIAGLLTQINTSMNDIINQRIQNARNILQAQGQVASSAIGGTGPGADIARARQDVTNAANLLSFDQAHHAGQAQILQDQAAVNQAQQQLNSQIQARDQQIHQDLAAFIQSEIDLQKSRTIDPIRQLREQLAGDIRLLSVIKPSDYKSAQEYQTAVNEARAKINQDRNSLNDSIIQADLRNLEFEHNIHKITDQAYIDGLRHILRNKHLSIEERQQVLEQIYNLQHQSSQLDLNVGSIKLPSIYQIRRAIGLGKRGELPAAQNTIVNHSANVVVNVYGPRGAQAVGKVLDDHLGTTVKSAMRAKGLV